MIEITLPYPPSMNHYKRVGRLVTTKTGKIYQSRVNTALTTRFLWEVAALVRGKGVESLGGAPISLEVDVYSPDKRRRDVDNILKVLLDALQHAKVYDDDNQIARLLVTRMSTIPKGQIVVRIQEL